MELIDLSPSFPPRKRPRFEVVNRRGFKMRKTTLALAALGFVGAVAISAPVSTHAQSIGFYGPGVGIELTTRPYNHRHARYDRYYDNQPYAYQYYRGPDYRYRAYTNCHPSGCTYRY
jgi:hypothetical protein